MAEKSIAMAELYIEVLTGSVDTPMTYQTFPDNAEERSKGKSNLRRILHGPIRQRWNELARLNDQGAGVFVTVNETDLKGRCKENIVAPRAIFVDDDEGVLPDELPLEPAMRVHSCAGDHAYWPLLPGVPLSRFEPTQERVILCLGTDPKVKDLPRVMRLPGFYHRKGAPVLVTVDVNADVPRRALRDIEAAFPTLRTDAAKRSPASTSALPSPEPEEPYNTRLLRAEAWLARRQPSIQGQHGDDQLYGTALFLLKTLRLSPADARKLLEKWNLDCVPPWEPPEIQYKIDRISAEVAPVLDTSAGRISDNCVEEAAENSLRESGLLPPAARLPATYTVTASGELACQGHVIASTPIVITRRSVDKNGSVFLTLAWHRRGKLKTHTVPRDEALSAQRLTSLARVDCPVNSTQARAIVSYLAAYEAINDAVIPEEQSASSFGWQQIDDEHVFLLPDRCLGASDETPSVAFRAESDGDLHFASQFRSNGTLAGSLDAVKGVHQYPVVMSAIYASLAPVMLKPLNAANFFCDICHSTSTGKSTALGMAASMWGSPATHGGFMQSCNATTVGVERIATLCCDLPLFLDETTLAQQTGSAESFMTSLCYMIANGQGRSRGALHGRLATPCFRTIALTTGEEALTSNSSHGGLQARVITAWGSPFQKTISDFESMNDRFLDNFGHIGPAFTHAIVKNRRSEAPQWRLVHKAYSREFASKLTELGGVSSRLASYFATLKVTAKLAHQYLELPFEYQESIEQLAELVVKESDGVDKVDAAVRLLYDTMVQQADRFSTKMVGGEGSLSDDDAHDSVSVHRGGWAGMLDLKRGIGFVGTEFKKVLRDHGFNPRAMAKLMGERGYLETYGDGKLQVKAFVGNRRVSVYLLNAQAIEKACGVTLSGSALRAAA